MIFTQKAQTDLKASSALRYLSLLIAGVVVFNLFYLGSKPVAVGLFLPPWDKVAHALAFSGITALLWFGVNGRLPFAVVLLVAVIGAADEIHQSTLPGREADVLDFATDAAAALCTACLLHWYNRWRQHRAAVQNK